MLRLAIFSVCLALCAAQLLSAGGPLDAAGAGTGTTGTGTTGTGTGTGTTGTGTDAISQLFRNPLMSLGLTGGDNMYRAFMMPYLQRMGSSNAANWYFLRGGMDKYASAMMSDMMGRMMAQSTGMNPMMASIFAGQMMDAPDNYALHNILLNRGGLFNQGGSSGSGAQGSGLLPNGAANPFAATNPFVMG